MKNIEVYSVLKNDIIQGVFYSSTGIDGVEKSIAYEKLDHDKIIKVPEDFEGKKKQSIKEFDNDFKIHPLSKRIKDGYVKIPEGHKLENEEIIPMTIEEKVVAGIEEIDPIFKAVGNDIIKKTDDELISEGIKTKKQIDEEKQKIADEKLIQQEMRKIAISNLGNKIKIIKE